MFIYASDAPAASRICTKRPLLSGNGQRHRGVFGKSKVIMAKKPDRRVRRTHELLEAALLSLIKEKEFDAISVQEIIDRANVGRATFYAHYDNKEDLLESGFDGLLETLREHQRQARLNGGVIEDRLFAFSHHLLAHAAEH